MSSLPHNQPKLTDESLMTFGKYAGTKLANIPASYFIWASKNLLETRTTKPLFDYIRENKEVFEQGVKRG